MPTPIELLDLNFLSGHFFGINRGQLADEEAGGLGQTVQVVDEFWEMEYEFAGWITQEDKNQVQQFLAKLNGYAVPALVYDPDRVVPLVHYAGDEPLASGSPWGAPSLSAIDRAASTLSMTGWSAGHEVSIGDYFSFVDDDGRYHLHRAVDPGTADAGGNVTVLVEPRPARNITVSSPALRIREACCTAVMSWRPDMIRRSLLRGAPFTLKGRQTSKGFL